MVYLVNNEDCTWGVFGDFIAAIEAVWVYASRNCISEEAAHWDYFSIVPIEMDRVF
jgi:hypothetical protein